MTREFLKLSEAQELEICRLANDIKERKMKNGNQNNEKKI